MTDVVEAILTGSAWFVLGYFLLVNGWLLALVGSAALELRRTRAEEWHEPLWRVLSSPVAPSISILAPAYNEEATVSESVRSLLTLRYPNLEVVVINDGSPDGTLDRLCDDFDLRAIHAAPVRRRLASAPIRGIFRSRRTPSLVVVDKENGGKADALNAGLDVATGELICAIDADTIVEPDALQRMVRPFLAGEDVVAAGGTIRAVNGSEVRAGRVVRPRAPRRLLPALQAAEYLRAFGAGRLGWNRLGGNLIISGAFGLFRREAVIAAGGYLHGTVGEDMELVARMRRVAREKGGRERVLFIADPVAWTEVPSGLRVLGRQRDRWHRGLADVLARHRRVQLNPRYGTLGMVVMPYFLTIELIAPVIELLGIVALGVGLWIDAVDVHFALLFLLVAYGLGLLVTATAIALEEWTYRAYGGTRDRLWLLGAALIDGFGYRQLTSLWRVRGLWRFARGRTDWGAMTRAGFRPAAQAPTLPPGSPDPSGER